MHRVAVRLQCIRIWRAQCLVTGTPFTVDKRVCFLPLTSLLIKGEEIGGPDSLSPGGSHQ